MLQDAQEEIIVASTGMSRIFDQHMFWRDPGKGEVTISFGQFLYFMALRGVKVTVVMYHEDNITTHQMKRMELDATSLKAEVERAFLRWSTLRDTFDRQVAEGRGSPHDVTPGGAIRIVQLRQRHLPYRVTFTEKRVLLTLRFYTEMFNSGLCFDAVASQGPVDRNNMPVHMQIREELQYLIEQNLAASEDRYQEWLRSKRA